MAQDNYQASDAAVQTGIVWYQTATTFLGRRRKKMDGRQASAKNANHTCYYGSGVEDVPEGQHQALLHEGSSRLAQPRPQAVDGRLSLNLTNNKDSNKDQQH